MDRTRKDWSKREGDAKPPKQVEPEKKPKACEVPVHNKNWLKPETQIIHTL